MESKLCQFFNFYWGAACRNENTSSFQRKSLPIQPFRTAHPDTIFCQRPFLTDHRSISKRTKMGMSFFSFAFVAIYSDEAWWYRSGLYYSDPPSIKLSGIRYCRPDAVCIDALSNILVLETCLIEMIDKNGQFLWFPLENLPPYVGFPCSLWYDKYRQLLLVGGWHDSNEVSVYR